jgi:hypothetical protein
MSYWLVFGHTLERDSRLLLRAAARNCDIVGRIFFELLLLL